MKTELNVNEMEQINGGNFFADLEDVLRRIFAEPSEPAKPDTPNAPKILKARVKC